MFELSDRIPESSLIVCVGYRIGEVIPYEKQIPEQVRIIEYLQKNSARSIRLQDTTELRNLIRSKRLSLPEIVEIVGAWYNACVYGSALEMLRNNSITLIAPERTISIDRLYPNPQEISTLLSEEEDNERKKSFLRQNISINRFRVREQRGILICSRN